MNILFLPKCYPETLDHISFPKKYQRQGELKTKRSQKGLSSFLTITAFLRRPGGRMWDDPG